ncbi:MAG: DUF2288 domain-containing protein [Oceanococcaceae bacterium]
MKSRSATYYRLLGETARVRWAEIERLFAAGTVLHVAPDCDLPTVAEALAEDNAVTVRQWMDDGLLAPLEDAIAQRWATDEAADLWAVVVRPWVLVQERQSP